MSDMAGTAEKGSGCVQRELPKYNSTAQCLNNQLHRKQRCCEAGHGESGRHHSDRWPLRSGEQSPRRLGEACPEPSRRAARQNGLCYFLVLCPTRDHNPLTMHE